MLGYNFISGSSNQPERAGIGFELGGVLCVGISADRNTIVSCARDGGFHVYRDSRAQVVGEDDARFDLHRNCSIGISADGKWAAIGHYRLDGRAKGAFSVFNLLNKSRSFSRDSNSDALTATCVSQNGDECLTASEDGSVFTWSIGRQQILKHMKHEGGVSCASMSIDARYAITGGQSGVFLWDVGTGTHLAVLTEHNAPVTASAISWDGSFGATGDESGRICVWDLQEPCCLESFKGNNSHVASLSTCRYGNFLVSGGGMKDASVKLWDVLEVVSPRTTAGPKGWQIDNDARAGILEGEAKSIVFAAGHMYRDVVTRDIGIDAEIEFRAQGSGAGPRVYLQLKSGDSYLKELADGCVRYTIDERHGGYWATQMYRVMLVVRTSNGQIRWMDISQWLRKHGSKTGSYLVDFVGEKFTSSSFRRLHQRLQHPAAIETFPESRIKCEMTVRPGHQPTLSMDIAEPPPPVTWMTVRNQPASKSSGRLR